MKSVHQHPDGMVFVRVDGEVYADTKENFERDFSVTFPPLPEGAIERIYDQGRRHAIQAEGDVIGGGEMPWKLGDQVINGLGTALKNKKQRDDALEQLRREEQRVAVERQLRDMQAAAAAKQS
jgi:hypothetical protein